MRVDQEAGRSRSPYFYENPLRVNDESWGYFIVFPSLKVFLCAQRWLPFAGQFVGHRAPGRFPIFYPSFFAVGEVPKWVLREAVAAPSENELHVVPKYRPSSPPPAFSGRLLDADEIIPRRGSGGHGGLHLVIQPAHPAIGHGCRNHAAWFAGFT